MEAINLNEPMPQEAMQAILRNMRSAIESCEAAVEILKKEAEASSEAKIRLSYAIDQLTNVSLAKRWLIKTGEQMVEQQKSPG